MTKRDSRHTKASDRLLERVNQTTVLAVPTIVAVIRRPSVTTRLNHRKKKSVQ